MVHDEDGDGRPDLIFERFFEVALYDWDTDTYVLAGPPVVARSQPDGAFAFEGAIDRLQRDCKSLPGIRTASPLELYAAAVCSRLQGMALATTEAAYRDRCRKLKPAKSPMYPSEYMATCTRGPTGIYRRDDVPETVHDSLAVIELTGMGRDR